MRTGRPPIHGESSGQRTAEYRTWKGLKNRCENPNNKDYINYGKRGIRVHPEWSQSYEAFLRDVGRRPTSKHSIGRKNNEGNYEPGNVQWETSKQQGNNRRNNQPVTFRGETKTCSEWADQLKVNWRRLYHRIFILDWDIERALTQPIIPRRARS